MLRFVSEGIVCRIFIILKQVKHNQLVHYFFCVSKLSFLKKSKLLLWLPIWFCTLIYFAYFSIWHWYTVNVMDDHLYMYTFFGWIPGVAGRRLSTVCKWPRLRHIQRHCRVHHIRVWKAEVESKSNEFSLFLICLNVCMFILYTNAEVETNRFMVQLFKMEDVSMGMWVEQFNSSKPVDYLHSLKFCQFGCIEDYYTAHYQSPRQMICMWDKLQQHGRPQCCNMRWQKMQQNHSVPPQNRNFEKKKQ